MLRARDVYNGVGNAYSDPGSDTLKANQKRVAAK